MDGYQYKRKCMELLKAKGFSKVQVAPRTEPVSLIRLIRRIMYLHGKI